MTRHIATALVLALGLAPVLLAPTTADAQSEADLAAAKKAYAEGKKLFEGGKFDKAVDKFKESYKLSKNPLLLYNIALTLERLRDFDMAIFYYKKFLSDSPEDAAQRADAQVALEALEKLTASSTTEDSETTETTETVETVEPPPVEKVEKVEKVEPPKKKITKRDTCLVEDFQHEVVDEAPPGMPLDLSAFVDEEATCDVSLYYRASGEEKFTVADMKPRYNELVARIPSEKMAGNAVQYYIEVKSSGGEMVTRIGKATSPNVIFIDEAAKPRYYPDLDDGDGSDAGADTMIDDDSDNPLQKGKKKKVVADSEDPTRRSGGSPVAGSDGGGGGFFDVGSSKFGYAKWGATGLAGGGIALSVTFALMASSWAGSIEAEAATSNDENCTGGPPCRPFDDYRKSLQDTGKRYETMSRVFLGVGVVGIGVAGYFWYKELKGRKKGERPSSATTFVPVIGDDLIGGSAAIQF